MTAQVRRLDDCVSHCTPTQKSVVSTDGGKCCKHIAQNPLGKSLLHYHVDGDVISGTETQKCDWLLLNETDKHAYFIELKGSGCDLQKAIHQLESTQVLLFAQLKEKEYQKMFFRIVFRSGAPARHDRRFIQLREKCPHGCLKVTNRTMEEVI